MTTAPSSLSVGGDYDLLVVGATPGGISCALRAAREGLRVLLTEASHHVGGMWTSGVQVFDTRYAGHRCPVLSEFTARIEEYYRRISGDGSPDHALACFGDASRHGERPRFEPHVAEHVFREMLADQPGVRLALGQRLESVNRRGCKLQGAVFRAVSDPAASVEVSANFFVDATYEADLASMAGAAFRIGREGRDDFGEPHAGIHFTTIEPIGEVGVAIADNLNLHFFNRTSRRSFAGSSGQSDRAVQGYSARLLLTNRPDNRVDISRPSGYSRETYLGVVDRSPDAYTRRYPLSSHYLRGEIGAHGFAPNLPRGKMDWLASNLVGGNHDYPLADVRLREELYRRHVAHSLGLLHFLQHDPAVPISFREHARQWGLARDEYLDNGHVPHQMYVREARRLAGLHVFTEHDAIRHPRHQRSPLYQDAIAFGEWPMDSHDCNPIRQPESFNDGEMILAEQTLPSQIPFRCLLTEAVENLLVPVAMSATHIGWGTLRLEPVFVHTGEVAGLAAALCQHRSIAPAFLESGWLQSELLRRRIAVAYFSDLDLGSDDPATHAVQRLAGRGFFGSYHASLDRILTPGMLSAWRETLAANRRGDTDPNIIAERNVTPCDGCENDRLRIDYDLARGWNPRQPLAVREAAQQINELLKEAGTVRALSGNYR